MGHDSTERRGAPGATVAALAVFLLVFAATANAAPFHPREHSLDLEGLNHACGIAVDSKGDFYASSEGKEVKVYNPSHTLLTSIPDANEPCGLAVTSAGSLYVSEQGTGDVVRFKPTVYPFVGTPTYEPREVIDSSGNAKGIAVDRFDNRLYVAEGTKVAIYKADGTFEANVGEGTLSEASGVAAFTYAVFPEGLEKQERYLWVADAAGADHLDLFRGEEAKALKLRRELTGTNTPDGSFGFGATGVDLAEDPGNRGSKGECKAVGEQACTAGHLFLYDAEHKALDEFDASGVYLDQTKNAGFADAEPTQVAIERSGGSGDGTIYVSAGAGAGSKALAFGPLKPPSRKTLKEPSEGGLSQILEGASDVATDSHGDAYVVSATASTLHIYSPKGIQITEIEDETEGEGNAPVKVAVDSTGKVYVLDVNGGFTEEAEVTYYEPSEYPPKAATTYTRHEPAVVTSEDFPIVKPAKSHPNPSSIAVNPGPGAGKDHLLVATGKLIFEFGSAAEGSGVLNEALGKCAFGIESIAVDGSSGTVYVGGNNNAEGGLIYEVNATGECLARFANSGASNGKIGAGVHVAVDQSNGHLIEYDQRHGAREYDAAGAFVAEFGSFTEGVPRGYGVAVDSACATHEPPLTGSACEAFDPADGTAYVAFDDPSPSHPPYDLNAFGPLKYPEPVKRKLTVVKEGSGSGKVTGLGIACPGDCEEEFLETEVVLLTAKADPENKFEGWVGCEAETVSPTEGTCEVTMDEAREVKAEFITEKTKKLLKVVIEGSGKVTGSGIDCPGDCEELIGEGNKTTLSASAPPGSEFVKWQGGDCEGIPATTCTLTMDQDEEVTAEFGVEQPLLTVTVKGNGAGTVASEDGFIECPPTCSHKYDLDDEVVLQTKADPGSGFAGWTGCDAEFEPEPGEVDCEVTMSKAKEVTATFVTLPKAKVKPALVAYDEATLRGEVDPSSLATKYRFKYLTQQEYEDNGETFEGAETTEMEELAAGEGFVAVEAPLAGLDEGVEYRFRLGAENAAGSAPEDEGSFVTLVRRPAQSCPNAAYRFGLSANLPDCRAYELVTPAQTSGLEPFAGLAGTSRSGVFSDWLTLQRGVGAGEDLAYFTAGTLPGFEGSGIEDGYRAQRGSGDHPADGWQSALFSPSYAEAAPGLNGSSFQLGVGADQLYSAWELNPQAENAGPQTLTKGAYLRTPGTANPKCNPQPLQSDFELIGCGSLGTDPEALSLYVSAEGAHVIFSSTEHLEKEAAPNGTTAIYDRAAGSSSAEVVSVKPNGTAFGGGEGASYAGASEDGSAVVFSAGGALYLHRAGQTTEIATAPNTFAGISEEGTRVFYAVTAKGEEAAPLFVCDTGAGSCAGSEKTHDPIEIAAAGIFTAVSPDGSHAFFSSTEVLTEEEANENGEEAKLGAHNLYAWDGADVRFLGRLVAADLKGGGGFAGEANMNLSNWTRAISRGAQSGRAYAPSRSTPGGETLVFQSHARLSAYDNEGKGEIYRYDPGAEEGERLTCVSCSPTGAPPSTTALLEDIRGFTNTPVRPTTMIANLTEDGQEVFFQSFDRLLPEDANEVEDVYEWKAKGAEGPGGDVCQRPGGCLSLISSGQGETPSILFAMSADGRDVFFQTKEKLVGEDVAGSPSIYDARLGGGIPEPSPPAPCQGDACQGQGSEPPALSNPATTGSGEAGVAPPPTPPRHCAKGKHRVKGRCVKRPGKRHAKAHHKANSKRGGKR